MNSEQVTIDWVYKVINLNVVHMNHFKYHMNIINENV